MKCFCKNFSLLAALWLVSLIVVSIETGSFKNGIVVASVTGPVKFIVALVHAKFWS